MICEPIKVIVLDNNVHVKEAATRLMNTLLKSRIELDIEAIALLCSFLRQCGVEFERRTNEDHSV